MKQLNFFFAFCICCLNFNAQTFSGQISDAKTNKAIAFANIGIINKPVGTMTDESGKFSLVIDDKYNDDVLNISMIGYRPISIKVSDFKTKYANSSANITMQENSYSLAEVIVRPVKHKTKIVGNTNTGQPCINFIGDDSIKPHENPEVGPLIKIRHPAFIDNISFCICSNDFDSITIRINVYQKYTYNVLRKPIYVTIKKGQTKISVDTRDYNIKVNDDFIIAFEALNILQHPDVKGKAESKKLSFSGGFLGSDMVLRESIYSDWRKVPAVVVGFNATITYEAKK